MYGSGSSVMSRPELKNGVLGRGRARVAPTYMGGTVGIVLATGGQR